MRKLLALAASLLLLFSGALPAVAAIKCDLPYYDSLGGDLALTDFDGKPFKLENMNGKIKWIYFGYTSCPDACPTAMANFKRLLSYFGEERDNIEVLFVTIDPERDSNERLKKYLKYFGPNFTGLSGTDEETRTAATRFGVSYYKSNVKTAMGTIFNHTDRYFLVDQLGNLRGIYSSNQTDLLAADTSLMYWADILLP